MPPLWNFCADPEPVEEVTKLVAEEGEGSLMKILGLMLLVIGMAGAVTAQKVAPEIDGGSAVGALCLLSGALVLIRSRLKK